MWEKIKAWFKDSETIFWARFQVFLGAVIAGVMGLLQNPSVNESIKTILKPEYVPYYVIGFGILTEILRRRRADDM